MSDPRSAFRVLVVDDEPEIVRDLVDLLTDEGYEAHGAGSGAEALRTLATGPFDLVLADLRMPPPDGIALARALKVERPELPVIILTAHADPTLARAAIEAGASDYVTKPWNTFELLLRVRRLRERWDLLGQRARLLRLVDHLGARGEGLEDLVGASARMREVFDLVRRVAVTEATVLLRGESGTGKSAIAAAIHRRSPRASGPFLKINCGALPEPLLESELFGHEKGAFTGAIRRKPGLFEVAEGARSCSTRSATCPLRFRSRSYKRSRSGRSFGSEGRNRCGPRSGCSRRPIETSKTSCGKGGSGRTSTTD